MYRRLLATYSVFILLLHVSGCASIGATPEASVADMPSQGAIGKTMKANSERFAACGRDSVTVQTGSEQNIKLRFTVTPQGVVENAQIEKMSAPDPDLRSCVLHALRKIRFPAPKDGEAKNIVYPITLRPE
jgi:TonB family protein